MKLLFLGTGAADWLVKPECEMGDKERRYSSMLVDGHILIDVAPQSYGFAKKLGIDLSAITDLYISHTHYDHYNKDALLGFRSEVKQNIKIHCHKGAVSRLGFTEDEKKLFDIEPMELMEKYSISGYEVTVLPANHIVVGSEEKPIHFIFSGDEKMFYGCDGGWFVAETWEYIMPQKFDIFILDATVGDKDGDLRLGTHNSVPMLRLILAAIKENHMANPGCRFFANHIAMTLHPASFEETKAVFEEFGMILTYDGLQA